MAIWSIGCVDSGLSSCCVGVSPLLCRFEPELVLHGFRHEPSPVNLGLNPLRHGFGPQPYYSDLGPTPSRHVSIARMVGLLEDWGISHRPHTWADGDTRLWGTTYCLPNLANHQAIFWAITNMQVDGSQLVAVVGPSGSGKTTLLNLLARRTIPSEGMHLYPYHQHR